jgi:electron transfer flavoprotein alpha subunit
MLSGLEARQPMYSGEVWVVAELNGDKITAATFELIGKARELADSLETQVGLAIAGAKVEPFAQYLIESGADKVYFAEHPLLAEFDPHSYRKVIAGVIEKYWPQIVLFAANPQGRVLAPMVSYRLDCGLTADCTSLDIRDSSRKGEVAVLMQTRPALGGNVMATICTKDSKCQMATARPGVMKRLPADPTRKGQVIAFPVELNHDEISLEIITTERGSGNVNFNAEVIVAGGKGIQSRDRYENIMTSLCTTIGANLGVSVERGASRAAVEQGYVERVHQVGQTGTAVGPTVYMALGISGAIQHMIGVANSQTILAINNDPGAPILKQCDYYMVANIEEVVPKLVDILGDK